MIIQGTHRAYMGADTVIAAFVRDDDGRKDLEDMTITASVQVGPGKEVVSFPVTGDSKGRITFTVDGVTTEQRLAPGTFALRVEAEGQMVYTGILEMV